MSREEFRAACRDCADLVAVYESPGGDLGVLLRQTPVPLSQEQETWRTDTWRAARVIVDRLRAVGFRGRTIILQWASAGEAAEVMLTWPCRYDGDRNRRMKLTRLAKRYAADDRYLDARADVPGGRPRARSTSIGP
jgi:hypothetical protein